MMGKKSRTSTCPRKEILVVSRKRWNDFSGSRKISNRGFWISLAKAIHRKFSKHACVLTTSQRIPPLDGTAKEKNPLSRQGYQFPEHVQRERRASAVTSGNCHSRDHTHCVGGAPEVRSGLFPPLVAGNVFHLPSFFGECPKNITHVGRNIGRNAETSRLIHISIEKQRPRHVRSSLLSHIMKSLPMCYNMPRIEIDPLRRW